MSDEPLVPRKTAVDQVRKASERWDAALNGFDGYATRLRTLAEAARGYSRAVTLADLANVQQNPRPGASKMRALAPELDPAHDRPGPPKLWRRFDQAVKDLGPALEEGSITTIAGSFAELSVIANELASACELETAEKQSKVS